MTTIARKREVWRKARARWRSVPENRAKAADRRRLARDKERLATYRRKSTPEGWARYAIARIRYRARKANIEFAITWRDIIPPAVCPVLGIPLKLTQGRPSVCAPDAPSVDRRDNSRGYVPGNVFVISNRANLLKKDATPDELRRLLEYVS